jgi:hypothetical protein
VHPNTVGSGPVLPVADYLRQGLDPAAAVLARQADLLVRGGVDRAAVQSAARAAGVGATASSSATVAALLGPLLVPVGDLDGNGVRDVIEPRYGKPASNGTTALVLFARDGARGGVLWSRRTTVPKGHFVLPQPLRTGASGGNGVVLFDVGATESANHSIRVSVALTGLSRLGGTLWTHAESGTLDLAGSAGPSEQHVPDIVGIAHASGPADDVIMSRTDASSDSSGQLTGTVTPLRVNAAKGTEVVLGQPVKGSAGVPSVAIVGDVNADKRGDIAVVAPGNAVESRAGSDGRTIWRNTALTLNQGAFAAPVGDVHASAAGQPAAPDVAVATGTPPPPATPAGLPIPNPLAANQPSHGEVALLDGSSGTTVWSKAGDFPYAVYKAGKPLVPATGVLTSNATSDGSNYTETLTLTTYDDSGTQVYSRDYTLSTPASSDSTAPSFGVGIAIPVGDFEPDGSLDGIAFLFVVSGNNQASKQVLLHGADGSPLPDSAADPLGGSASGRGDDLVHTSASSRGITVNVRRGSDDKTLFTRTVPVVGISSAKAYGAGLRGRCADVVVVGTGDSKGMNGVLASSGQPRWTVTFAAGDLRPGTLNRPSTAPARLCA